MAHLYLDLGVADVIGLLGFSLYMLNYTSLSLRWVSGDSVQYLAMNMAAATCVLVGLTTQFNLPSAMIQVFWIVLSVFGIVLRLRNRASHRRAAERAQTRSNALTASP
ncbi:hypothetical protein [Aestuariivita sp.]|jgi:FlaA1/EpsC-like NDP-sugar epimerase|uniref:CBU_0592 family membrane protein n=1 Tax=Aestuariivita sp. TaxID=1872407 RepID=UPI00216DE902|nr:hypothetical protein [Aestuariivita sp.]MCE8008688.1 hypothetical protein [Aestuariivita sp.]